MINYTAKFFYLYNRQNFICPICGKFMLSDMVVLHHKNARYKWREKKRPLFQNSILNLVCLHTSCHSENRSWGVTTDYNSDKYELFLKNHLKLAVFVNNP